MPVHSIGDVARATGLSTSAIRYYESIGLLPKAERSGGKRRFDDQVIARLFMIQTATALGFNLREVRLIVNGAQGGRRGLEQLKTLAKKKLPEVERTLRRARLIKRFFQAAQECQCPSLDDCFSAACRAGLAPHQVLRQQAP